MINSVAGVNMLKFCDNFLSIGVVAGNFNFADDGCYMDRKIHCFSFCNKQINKLN